MVAWFLNSLLLLLCCKFIFSGASFIPYALPLDAAPMLLPLAIRIFGPASVWSFAISSFLFDLAHGVPLSIMILRMIGWWISTAFLLRLVSSLPHGREGVSIRSLLHLGIASVLIMIAQAAWGALGAEVIGWYSFGYVWFLAACSHLLLTSIIGVTLYALAYPILEERFGDWSISLPPDPEIGEPHGTLWGLLLASGPLAFFLAWIFNIQCGVSPFRPSILGLTSGTRSIVLGVLTILLQCVALLLPSWRLRKAESLTQPSVLGAPSPTWIGILKR